MPGSRTAVDDLTERRRRSKNQVHGLPTRNDSPFDATIGKHDLPANRGDRIYEPHGSGYHVWLMNADGRREHRTDAVVGHPGGVDARRHVARCRFRRRLLPDQCDVWESAERVDADLRRFARRAAVVDVTERQNHRLHWPPRRARRLPACRVRGLCPLPAGRDRGEAEARDRRRRCRRRLVS